MVGPLAAGTVLGQGVWTVGGTEVARIAYVTAAEVPRAPWWVEVWDHLVRALRSLWGAPGAS